MKLNYIVKNHDNNKKLKQILKEKLYISNRLLNKLKENDGIFVNEKTEFVNYIVKENDKIDITIPNCNKKFSDKFHTQKKELAILYEDDYLLMINKEANMPVHPSTDHYDNTLANFVAYYLEEKGINGIHVITRLDKNTSGICIFAKNEYIQELFIRKKEEMNLYKEYVCVVDGILKEDHAIIEKNISRKKDTIILREVNEMGDYAKTEYETLERNLQENYSVAKVILHTGRTHQIRVHMASISHLLLGDELYANEYHISDITRLIDRQALHCKNVSFYHPITNQYINIHAPIPDDIARLMHSKTN